MMVVKVVAVLMGLALVVGGGFLALSLGMSGNDVSTARWLIQMSISFVAIASGVVMISAAAGTRGWKNRGWTSRRGAPPR